MTRIRCQAGYALILMLLIMIGGSTWWLSEATQSLSGSSGSLYSLSEDSWAMIDARQALLSYTSLYPYLYGPSGSGPGHLPCPDTDYMSTSMTGSPFSGDGPNPPCGATMRSTGQLPRHVTLPGIRHSFHSQPTQRFGYTVYSHVVNNPVNRMVNPSLLSTAQPVNTIAAMIESNTAASQSRSDRMPMLSITNSALVEVVIPAVAAWIVDIVEHSDIGLCPILMRNVLTQDTQASRVETIQRCQRFAELRALCGASVDAENPSDRGNNTDDVLLILVDELPEDDLCISEEPALSLMEGIAAHRHWFVRNQWAEWIRIESSTNCLAGVVECSLRYKREEIAGRASLTSQILTFLWEPNT